MCEHVTNLYVWVVNSAYEWVMSHTLTNASCYSLTWIHMSQVKHACELACHASIPKRHTHANMNVACHTLIWVSHVTHTHEWVMSLTLMCDSSTQSYVSHTHTNTSWHKPIRMSHVTHSYDGDRHTLTWMRHDTHMSESCHILPYMRHVTPVSRVPKIKTHTNKSCHSFIFLHYTTHIHQCVLPRTHTNVTCHTHLGKKNLHHTTYNRG